MIPLTAFSFYKAKHYSCLLVDLKIFSSYSRYYIEEVPIRPPMYDGYMMDI